MIIYPRGEQKINEDYNHLVTTKITNKKFSQTRIYRTYIEMTVQACVRKLRIWNWSTWKNNLENFSEDIEICSTKTDFSQNLVFLIFQNFFKNFNLNIGLKILFQNSLQWVLFIGSKMRPLAVISSMLLLAVERLTTRSTGNVSEKRVVVLGWSPDRPTGTRVWAQN